MMKGGQLISTWSGSEYTVRETVHDYTIRKWITEYMMQETLNEYTTRMWGIE